MQNKCGNIQFSFINFFSGYERIIIIIFGILSLILNLIIIISICLSKNKNISIIIRLTSSILLVNFIHIVSYSFQWVICKKENKNNDDNVSNKNDSVEYEIALLLDGSTNNYICNFQSFLILSSSLSQDYLIILFFFIVNYKEIIKIIYINLFNILAILFSISISTIFTVQKALGVNDDFCFIKKFQKKKNNNYSPYEKYNIYAIIIYSIKGINFIISLFLFIIILKYIVKQKTIIYLFNKLSILLIQLFKLFIVLCYRIPNFFFKEYPDDLRKIYAILSTLDGVLMPLAYILSNDLFYNLCKIRNMSKTTVTSSYTDLDFDVPNFPILPENEEKESVPQSNFAINPIINNTNNFDFSFENYEN